MKHSTVEFSSPFGLGYRIIQVSTVQKVFLLKYECLYHYLYQDLKLLSDKELNP